VNRSERLQRFASRSALARPAAVDTAFLAVLALAPVAFYIGRLGFYSDDWAFLSFLAHSDDKSVWGLTQLQYEGSANIKPRPTQAAYQALLFVLFDHGPLGYHLVHSAVLVAMTLVLYWVLRELGVGRVLAVSIPAVYALLPNYSTDRFYFAAFGYALTMVFYLLSLYADLRAIRTNRFRLIAWKSVALGALLVAGFGYEVVLPLLFLNVGVVLFFLLRRRRRREAVPLSHPLAALAFFGTNLCALLGVVVFKAQTAVGANPENMSYLIRRLAAGTVVVNFGTYGVALPQAVYVSVQRLDALELAAGSALALLVFAYVGRLWRLRERPLLHVRTWLVVAAAGVGVFVLGYAVFLTTYRISFSSTGIANRAGIAGALGAAIVLVAALALVGFVLPRAVRRWWFPASIAALCASGFFIVATLANSWERAWREERAVLRDIRAQLPPPARGSTILLEGVCPYVGPAIVFESSWDLAGALQVMYRDPTLKADVTTNRLHVGDKSISTVIYGVIRATYSYERLLLFDFERKSVREIDDARSLRRHLDGQNHRCTRGEPGVGVPLFRFDNVYTRLERRNFDL
jgi:hypothetical protein